MDCCKYGEYRAPPPHYWEGYAPYALPYAPYAPQYYPAHAHDPYARYASYRYDYAAQQHNTSTEHAMPEYAGYATKEARARRAPTRRDTRPRTAAHLPLPPTPPLDCGMNARSPGYCEPQMWHHYQMGVMNSGGWTGSSNAWNSRAISCSREQVGYHADYRFMKMSQQHTHSRVPQGYPDGRGTPYSMYEEGYGSETGGARPTRSNESGSACGSAAGVTLRLTRDRDAKTIPVVEKRPPVVPLPAFQQAFGSTEIGKFAEAFSRTEPPPDEISDTFLYEPFSEWETPAEPQWSTQPSAREIKCEDSF